MQRHPKREDDDTTGDTMCETPPHIYEDFSNLSVIRRYIFAECGYATFTRKHYSPMARVLRYSPEPAIRTRLRGILTTFELFKWGSISFSRAKLRREIGRINRAMVIVRQQDMKLEVKYALRGLRQLYSDKKKSIPRTPTPASQPQVDPSSPSIAL